MKNPRRFFSKILLALFIFVILYLLFWPVPFDPRPWNPPKSLSFEKGTFHYNYQLNKVKRLKLQNGIGPEDIAIDSKGQIYAGLTNGNIVRLQSDGKKEEIFATTGGRPLGLHFTTSDNLIVADAYRGLLSISPQRKITVLSKSIKNVPYLFTNDVDISSDGIIYFTDSSKRFSIDKTELDFFEHHGTGRVMLYNPKTKSTQVLLENLYYPNGIAISKDQSFLLVVETIRYRITKYWLSGEKKGTTELFIENLPGLPTGISRNPRGTFWLAMSSPRIDLLDTLLPYPFFRKIAWRFPDFLKPKPKRHALVAGLNQKVKIIYNLQDPASNSYAPLTSVQEHNGVLYLAGGFQHAWQNSIARIAVDKLKKP